ncbi:hypothetical protein [Daejeonella sp.]|jgi:hypothetical protein|uniref:hypothetical protein n=1 Tax=Daejeonella sp. TaxID=2805397 RepID=UPI0027BB1915|nr:hypothetical protein [Daejeonella sp.]
MRILIFILTLAFSLNVKAQDANKTVTLVANGQGKTQEEAKQQALRSAIEQAFGTFISSKTEILNDNLVKDEIVSVANGNIQKFDVISEVEIPNVGYATSLKATVSVTKLTSFVESKGVAVEFKGGILAVNIRQQILNEENETKSMQNIANTCKEILDLSCDFEIVRGEPKQKSNDNNKWAIPISINVKFNKNIEKLNQYLMNSIIGLSMSTDEVNQYKQLGKQTYKLAIGNGDTNVSGMTYNISFLKKLAASNPNLCYRIVPLDDRVTDIIDETKIESEDIALIEKEIKRLNRQGYWGENKFYRIEYFDKTVKSIFHFRSLSTVVSIIDFIYYTKNSLLNFEITNGLELFNSSNLLTGQKTAIGFDNTPQISTHGDYSFQIIQDNLSPIFNSRCYFFNYKSTTNGPNTLFGTFNTNGNKGCKKGKSIVSLYDKIDLYYELFYYSGGRDDLNFENIYDEKYGFLYQADHDLPKEIRGRNNSSNSGYMTVISLFDFKPGDKNVASFYLENTLTLSDLEKVQEYKISIRKK